MKVFLVEKNGDRTEFCREVEMEIMPNCGDSVVIKEEDGTRRNFVVRHRRFVVNQNGTIHGGVWMMNQEAFEAEAKKALDEARGL